MSIPGHQQSLISMILLSVRAQLNVVLIMPKKTSTNSNRLEMAVASIKNHPTLSASEAMHLAGFSEEDRANPSLRRLVRHCLPGKGKRAFSSLSMHLSELVNDINGISVS